MAQKSPKKETSKESPEITSKKKADEKLVKDTFRFSGFTKGTKITVIQAGKKIIEETV